MLQLPEISSLHACELALSFSQFFAFTAAANQLLVVDAAAHHLLTSFPITKPQNGMKRGAQQQRKIHQPKDFRLGLQTLMLARQRQCCSVALSALHQAQPYRWWGYRKEEWIQLPEGSKAPDYVAPLYSPWTACALLNPSSFTLCALCIICMSYLAALAWGRMTYPVMRPQ